jgi:predicted transcriptional regulator
MRTIRQIADDLGVSKTAVRKRLTPEVQTKFVEMVSGTIYISEEGEKFIKSTFLKNEPQTGFAGGFGNKVSEVSSVLAALTKQLDVKDAQIDALTKQNTALAEQNKGLTAALNAAQLLHADTKKMLPGGADPDASAVATKKGFWDRFKR